MIHTFALIRGSDVKAKAADVLLLDSLFSRNHRHKVLTTRAAASTGSCFTSQVRGGGAGVPAAGHAEEPGDLCGRTRPPAALPPSKLREKSHDLEESVNNKSVSMRYNH